MGGVYHCVYGSIIEIRVTSRYLQKVSSEFIIYHGAFVGSYHYDVFTAATLQSAKTLVIRNSSRRAYYSSSNTTRTYAK